MLKALFFTLEATVIKHLRDLALGQLADFTGVENKRKVCQPFQNRKLKQSSLRSCTVFLN